MGWRIRLSIILKHFNTYTIENSSMYFQECFYSIFIIVCHLILSQTCFVWINQGQ